MDFSTRHIGSWCGHPAKIIELTINGDYTETITDLDGKVHDHIIESLKELVNELEEHNNKIENL